MSETATMKPISETATSKPTSETETSTSKPMSETETSMPMSETETPMPTSATSGDLALTSVISLIEELPILSGEELDVSEQQSEESYVPPPEPITEAKLKEISYTLGLITLHWPEDAVINVEERIHYPQSYRQNSDKEKLILWYAENFRKQFHFTYKDRKPLFLAAENECGLQKMVCTSIKASKVPYPELSTWKGCADFISDHLQYEPLDKPTNLPNRLLSPTAVLSRQAGHCFEYSTLLCSLLIGTGYSAYVVSGYAAREFCNNDQTMVTCPQLIQPPPPEPEEEEIVVSKYEVEPPPDLRSQFLLEMERRERQRAADDERKRQEDRRRAIEEFERPPPDDLHGLRLHSWILVLPPNKEVTEPFFIEPTTGNNYEIDDPHYLGIESIWNDTNYWVNLQDCSEGCKNLQFELNDNECWAHIFVGEPWQTRKETGETEGDPHHVLQEKHLDIPPSWVQRIEIPRSVFMNRYPKGQKCTFYKKAREEKFAPYVQTDGLVTRITIYSDYEWEDAEAVNEYYKNRKDLLYERKNNLKTESAVEQFTRGRKDALKEHFYYINKMSIEDVHIIKFYNEARFDDLEMLEMHPEYLKEHFKNREDLLYFRSTIFEPKLSYSDEVGDGRRVVKKITERFHRNPDKPPNEDVAERVFALSENEIRLRYYHGPHQITGPVREFTKPPLSERGENLTFDPDLTRGHQYDPAAPEPKNLALFYLLDEMLKTEEKSLSHVREIENEVDDILRTRDLETRQPKLLTSIFDRERNVEAKLAMKEKEQQKIEKKIREVEAETDYLAPYLARLGNPPSLTRQQALKIREECLSDYKQFLVDKATNIQNLFIKGTQALQAKSVWMEEERDSVTAGEEEEYLESVNETKFFLHTLEIRLNRHRENAPLRYLQMESYLRSDKRLTGYS